MSHALTFAPEEFRQRMALLRKAVNGIPGTEVLEFNWILGVGADRTKNAYVNDMGRVREADLMVSILDHPSVGLGLEIHERCRHGGPIYMFYPQGTELNQIIEDCASEHRLSKPTEYSSDKEIVKAIADWARANRPA